MSGTDHDKRISTENKYNVITIILIVVETGTLW